MVTYLFGRVKEFSEIVCGNFLDSRSIVFRNQGGDIMAYGDVGGAVTELIITCRSRTKDFGIEKGDALRLSGDYEVDNEFTGCDAIFGQAMSDATPNGQAIPVRVRGICVFRYEGNAPEVDGRSGVVGSDLFMGTACGSLFFGRETGINLRVDEDKKQVHVLL